MHRREEVLHLHAWLTIDGVHAIDQTLSDAPECDYLGIPFSTATLARTMWTRHDIGILMLLAEQSETAVEILELDQADTA
jgi:hypothetical protein